MSLDVINPELKSEFLSNYTDLHKSNPWALHSISEACTNSITATYGKVNAHKDNKGYLEHKYENLLRIKNVLLLNIEAKTAANNHYYNYTLVGKIEAFFKSFFLKNPFSSFSIDAANRVLTRCNLAISDMEETYNISAQDSEPPPSLLPPTALTNHSPLNTPPLLLPDPSLRNSSFLTPPLLLPNPSSLEPNPAHLTPTSPLKPNPPPISLLTDPSFLSHEESLKEKRLLRSRIDLLMMLASITEKVYIHRVGNRDNPSQILFANPNQEVYVPNLTLTGRIGAGATRTAFRGSLYTPSQPPKPIATLTTMCPTMNDNDETIEKVNKSTQKMLREQTLLQQFKDTDGIIHYYDFFTTQINRTEVGFAMSEEYKLGNLSQFLKSNTLIEKDKISLMKSLSKNIANLHRRKKIHRDLKPENILVYRDSNGELKAVLADFESCVDLNDEKRKSDGSGTIPFMAPEYFRTVRKIQGDTQQAINNRINQRIVEGKQHPIKIRDEVLAEVDADYAKMPKVTTQAIDMWALGLVYYKIWYGKSLLNNFKPPNDVPEDQHLDWCLEASFQTIENGDPGNEVFPPKNLDEEGNVIEDPVDEMIKQMLAIDPEKRMTAKELSAFWGQ